jgi:hypothetical protein
LWYALFPAHPAPAGQLPQTLMLFIAALLVAAPATGLTGTARVVAHSVLLVALIGAVAWLAIRVLSFLEEIRLTRVVRRLGDHLRLVASTTSFTMTPVQSPLDVVSRDVRRQPTLDTTLLGEGPSAVDHAPGSGPAGVAATPSRA